MPKTMLVALWLRDTYLKQGRSIENRLVRLSAALAKVHEIRERIQTQQPWADPDVVFVAPEYLFGRPTGEDWTGKDPKHPEDRSKRHPDYVRSDPQIRTAGRHLDESDKDWIKEHLVALSAKYPTFLIVPGTIAWSLRVRDHPQLVSEALARVARHRGRAVAGGARKISRLIDVREALRREEHGAASPSDEDVLENARLCLNTAFVLHGGDVTYVYSKQGDFYEVLPQYLAAHAFECAVPGAKSGLFQVGQTWFGIEVCYDHATAALSEASRGGGHTPLVHIITSADVAVNPGNCVVAPGGYALNAATTPARSGLWYRAAAGAPIPARVESPVVAGLRLPRPGIAAGQAPPASYKAYDDVAGSPLWVYRADVPD